MINKKSGKQTSKKEEEAELTSLNLN